MRSCKKTSITPLPVPPFGTGWEWSEGESLRALNNMIIILFNAENKQTGSVFKSNTGQVKVVLMSIADNIYILPKLTFERLQTRFSHCC